MIKYLWYNDGMKKMRRGFTIIEVSLFLAITGVVFVGIAIGTQNSIFWQRYNDSVQSFAEFLRSEYSRVANVQINDNDPNGDEDRAIYGRVVIFDGEGSITSYSVSGNADVNTNGGIIDMLGSLNAGIEGTNGITETFKPRWGSEIQTTARYNGGYTKFEGALLIVRHPSVGTIYTFVNKNIKNPGDFYSEISNVDNFDSTQVDFCVNPNGGNYSSLRKDVRIISDARNASGVEVVPDGDSGCKND